AKRRFDANCYYRLTTRWQGDDKSLDIVNDGKNNNQLILGNTGNYSGQHWKITSVGDGYYRLSTEWQGDGKCLDIVNDTEKNKLILANTDNHSGQYWRITLLENSYYRLTSKLQGYDQSLDVVNDGEKNKLTLHKTGNYSGQYWKITKEISTLESTQAEKDGKYLSHLKLFRQLQNLKIYFSGTEYNETVPNEVCSNLFQSDCRLQTLLLDHVYVPVNTHIIQRCFSIRNLTIKVHCFHNAYVLLNNLPSIESTNIAIPYIKGRHLQSQQQHHEVQFNYEKNIPSTLSKLKRFVFYSIFTAKYDYLELLLSHCCSNLEYLSLNLYIDQFIGGERLEKKLLTTLTKLKVFHFCFRIPVVDNTLNIDDYIQRYKSSYWIDNDHSILCFNQPLCNQYCVFSLPFMFNKFCYVSNDLVNYRSNINDGISLHSKQNKTKQISLCDKT
ncbi:unnamed protein product, partial [Didymodactylos carnosus]